MARLIADLECPKCKEVWGRMRFDFEKPVLASDVTILKGKKKKLKNGEALACTMCGHEMTNWDVILSIHASQKVSS